MCSMPYLIVWLVFSTKRGGDMTEMLQEVFVVAVVVIAVCKVVELFKGD
jgi:hypothetical protein